MNYIAVVVICVYGVVVCCCVSVVVYVYGFVDVGYVVVVVIVGGSVVVTVVAMLVVGNAPFDVVSVVSIGCGVADDVGDGVVIRYAGILLLMVLMI